MATATTHVKHQRNQAAAAKHVPRPAASKQEQQVKKSAKPQQQDQLVDDDLMNKWINDDAKNGVCFCNLHIILLYQIGFPSQFWGSLMP